MSTTFDITRINMCRSLTKKIRVLREDQGDEVARAVCVGGVDGYAAQIETMCGPEAAAEFFYRVADHIVARNAARITGNQSGGME